MVKDVVMYRFQKFLLGISFGEIDDSKPGLCRIMLKWGWGHFFMGVLGPFLPIIIWIVFGMSCMYGVSDMGGTGI